MVSVIPKHIAAFTLGTRHELNRKYKDESNPDTQWSGWGFAGGTWACDPVTIKRIDGEVDIFMVDTNHALQHSVFNFLLDNHLTPWKNLGGNVLGPPAVANSKGTIHIFHIGIDSALYHNSWDGAKYTPSQRLGGMFSHTPAAVSVGEKDVSVFAVGLEDSRLSHYHWTDRTGWEPPVQLPGIWAGPPSAVTDVGGFHVFGIDPDHKLSHAYQFGTEVGFQTLEASLTTIDAISWAPGRIDLIGLGLDSGVHHQGWDGKTWGPWENLKGVVLQRPTPVSHSPGALCVLGVGMDCVMYVIVRDPTTGVWGPWTNIGGTVPVISRVA